MIENQTAHYWRIMPFDFRGLNPEHQAELMATFITQKQVDAYYNSERSKQFKDRPEHNSERKPGMTIGGM